MKARVPKSFRDLKPSEQKRIEEICREQMSKDMMVVLDIYLKMSCAVLHDGFGFGEERLTAYLGNYRQLFRRHVKLVRAGNQIEVLDKQMRKIFRRSGYPDEFFRSMFADWNVKTDNEVSDPSQTE